LHNWSVHAGGGKKGHGKNSLCKKTRNGKCCAEKEERKKKSIDLTKTSTATDCSEGFLWRLNEKVGPVVEGGGKRGRGP